MISCPSFPDLLARPPARRGVLLLLTLSMLTLFLLMGGVAIVMATRARETARVFATATAAGAGSREMARELLDEALLILLRGSKDDGVKAVVTRSLLADRYGEPVKRRLTGLQQIDGTPWLRATVTNITPPNPLRWNGRVITFKPNADDVTEPTSYRIVETGDPDDSGVVAFRLANVRPSTPEPRPQDLPCDVYINGREFRAEPSDSFTSDVFLTHVELEDDQVKSVKRAAFGGGGDCVVDNDGDGVADGVWLEGVLRPRPTLGGGELSCKVSYLVLDLDGRINVNAHGTPKAGVSGPGDVDAAEVLDEGTWSTIVQGGTPPRRSTTSQETQWRPAPAVQADVDGRMQSAQADPYAVRLDLDGPRSAMLRSATTQANPFTVGDLERVLRQFDSDAATLPPRLAALLDDSAQKARMLITSESWDTPGITGQAAQRLAQLPDVDELPQDVAAGLRFDLNRPLPDDEAKEQFFKDLYRVVVGVGVPVGMKTAQWVANVVEFRDEDTAPTRFKFPEDETQDVEGFEPPGDGVLGAWNTGRFRSLADLLVVPALSRQEFQDLLAEGAEGALDGIASLVKDHPVILEAVAVPSPFRTTVMADDGNVRLSRWREPGRINVNTCDERVWRALVGGGESAQENPFAGDSPALTLGDLLLSPVTGGDGGVLQALASLETATRLASSGTIRSNVFAVWITVQINDATNTGASPPSHRLFAIVDRSIPVGYSEGENLNVREAIRLRRFID